MQDHHVERVEVVEKIDSAANSAIHQGDSKVNPIARKPAATRNALAPRQRRATSRGQPDRRTRSAKNPPTNMPAPEPARTSDVSLPESISPTPRPSCRYEENHER